jgi:hypothetical protein
VDKPFEGLDADLHGDQITIFGGTVTCPFKSSSNFVSILLCNIVGDGTKW